MFPKNTKSGSYTRKLKSEKMLSFSNAMSSDAQIETIIFPQHSSLGGKVWVVFFWSNLRHTLSRACSLKINDPCLNFRDFCDFLTPFPWGIDYTWAHLPEWRVVTPSSFGGGSSLNFAGGEGQTLPSNNSHLEPWKLPPLQFFRGGPSKIEIFKLSSKITSSKIFGGHL